MAITAGMVKELREMTGAGMMDCKKALTATEGNMDAAVDWLREKGLALSLIHIFVFAIINEQPGSFGGCRRTEKRCERNDVFMGRKKWKN